MSLADLDQRMRVYEQSLDHAIVPGMFMAARLDGRGFTRLTKETHPFDTPFDRRFLDHMTTTVSYLMECGFRIIYAHTQSDEISLLFHPDEDTFGRKVSKYESILAGEASAAFSVALGSPAAFDARMVPLPNLGLVQDYFLWRQADAHRNCLNAHCYWLLRHEGRSPAQATAQLAAQPVSYKNELLFSRGINFDTLPAWQKRGVGAYWEQYEKQGFNPKTAQTETAQRRRLVLDEDLPLGLAYAQMTAALAVHTPLNPATTA